MAKINNSTVGRLLYLYNTMLYCTNIMGTKDSDRTFPVYIPIHLVYTVNVLSSHSGYLPRVRKTHHTETINNPAFVLKTIHLRRVPFPCTCCYIPLMFGTVMSKVNWGFYLAPYMVYITHY